MRKKAARRIECFYLAFAFSNIHSVELSKSIAFANGNQSNWYIEYFLFSFLPLFSLSLCVCVCVCVCVFSVDLPLDGSVEYFAHNTCALHGLLLSSAIKRRVPIYKK